ADPDLGRLHPPRPFFGVPPCARAGRVRIPFRRPGLHPPRDCRGPPGPRGARQRSSIPGVSREGPADPAASAVGVVRGDRLRASELSRPRKATLYIRVANGGRMTTVLLQTAVGDVKSDLFDEEMPMT